MANTLIVVWTCLSLLSLHVNNGHGAAVTLLLRAEDYPKTEMINGCTFYNGDNNALDCSGLGLTEMPPITLFKVRTAVHMWLDHNNFARIYAGMFEGISATKFLFMDHNKITMIEDGALGDMTDLVILSLGFNQLSEQPPLDHLTLLTMLNLRDNSISEISADGLPGSNNVLNYLSLRNNPVSEVKCGTFDAVPKLNYLQMSGSDAECEIWDHNSEVHCFCNAAEVDGGSRGFCSNTCTEEIATGVPKSPPVVDGGINVITLGFSAEKVADIIDDWAPDTQETDVQVELGADDEKDSGELSAGAAAGLIAGVVAVLLVVIGVAVKRQNGMKRKVEESIGTLSSSGYSASTGWMTSTSDLASGAAGKKGGQTYVLNAYSSVSTVGNSGRGGGYTGGLMARTHSDNAPPTGPTANSLQVPSKHPQRAGRAEPPN
eukprot:m.259417 g.259417  ORF g.259417 m.259417 type:complete len:432 (+) comp19664_c0_seq1:104-1399(+)